MSCGSSAQVFSLIHLIVKLQQLRVPRGCYSQRGRCRQCGTMSLGLHFFGGLIQGHEQIGQSGHFSLEQAE